MLVTGFLIYFQCIISFKYLNLYIDIIISFSDLFVLISHFLSHFWHRIFDQKLVKTEGSGDGMKMKSWSSTPNWLRHRPGRQLQPLTTSFGSLQKQFWDDQLKHSLIFFATVLPTNLPVKHQLLTFRASFGKNFRETKTGSLTPVEALGDEEKAKELVAEQTRRELRFFWGFGSIQVSDLKMEEFKSQSQTTSIMVEHFNFNHLKMNKHMKRKTISYGHWEMTRSTICRSAQNSSRWKVR